jgi:hypothetical protein
VAICLAGAIASYWVSVHQEWLPLAAAMAIYAGSAILFAIHARAAKSIGERPPA